MNNISTKQNEYRQLELLFTQRKLYSSAKKIFSWRTLIALALAVLGPLLTPADTKTSSYIALFAFLFCIADIALLERIESRKRKTAARIQELFDTTVLELSWNQTLAKKPEYEIISSILNKYPNRDYSSLRLTDWYGTAVSNVDLSFARFLCQRSNVSWDSSLRKNYMILISVLLSIMLLCLYFYSDVMSLSLGQIMLKVAFPLLPLIQLFVRQIVDHMDSTSCAVDLKSDLDITIEQFISKQNPNNPEELARRYQDEIFKHRTKCPMIFDWLYYFFRDNQEKEMQFSVDGKIKEYLS